jgi:hypothetical protein
MSASNGLSSSLKRKSRRIRHIPIPRFILRCPSADIVAQNPPFCEKSSHVVYCSQQKARRSASSSLRRYGRRSDRPLICLIVPRLLLWRAPPLRRRRSCGLDLLDPPVLGLARSTVPLLFSLRILMLDFNLGPYDVYSKVPEQVMPKKSQGSRQAATAG